MVKSGGIRACGRDENNSSASSTRRPKAKALPRRGGEAVGGGKIIIRYDTAHDCRNMVGNHRGNFHVCGELGLACHHEVVETINRMTSTRDICSEVLTEFSPAQRSKLP